MRNELLEKIAPINERKDLPDFKVGDDIKVFHKIIEGDKERIQAFEGSVIGIKKSSRDRIITVRKISFGEGVERTFSLSSPRLSSIKVVRKGHVRRAKLYYLREKIGKKSKIKASKT